jgi:hypothetical protein
MLRRAPAIVPATSIFRRTTIHLLALFLAGGGATADAQMPSALVRCMATRD